MNLPPTGDRRVRVGRDRLGIPTDDVELAIVTRSGFVESRHRGHAVVVDADGQVVRSLGSPDGPMYPRSSLKPLQATGCLLAGAALDGPALAIAAGSHRGHPDHLELVAAVLADAGMSEGDLRCPPALPTEEWAERDYVRAGGRKRRVAMNCSGKHAGMLTACVAAGWDPATYDQPDHPLQQHLRGLVERVTGVDVATVGVDGCGAPLFSTTLVGLARSIGRVAAAAGTDGTGPDVEATMGRVARAMRAHPWAVSGIGSDDTIVMQELDGVVAKGGAEGVLAIGTAKGGGVAVKTADGNSRATMPVALSLLGSIGIDATDLAEALATPTLGGGRPVGSVHVSSDVVG